MAGGLLQLVAYGAQDVYLTGNPQVTYFKVSYRRHTNFAMEAIAQTFNGVADFGRSVMCTLSRNGDLLGRTYLAITLPQVNVGTNDKFRWTNWVGHAAVRYADFEIGGQRIDRQYGEWLQIWNELTLESGKRAGYASMVGNNAALTQLYVGPAVVPSAQLHIPLQFFFNQNVGQALPLIALQYHECKITIYFRDVREIVYLKNNGGGTSYPSLTNTGGDAQLWCDYFFLDTDERRRYAQTSHEYLISQVQFTGDESISSGSTQKIKLAFNHPVKELIWVVQKDDVVDYTNSGVMDSILGPQHWNFTTRADTTGLSGVVFNAFDSGLYAGSPLATNLQFASALSSTSTNNYDPTSGSNTYNSNFTWYSGTALGSTNATTGVPLLDLGVNPVSLAKLMLNGSDRFAERSGVYFNTVQPFQHHSAIPAVGINVYSFAISPELAQPSGSCNFSRIDQAQLNVTLNSDTFIATKGSSSTTTSAKLRIYAVNFNVLRVMSGMGGLAYSN